MSLITPDKIEHKIKRLYIPFLEAWLRGDMFLPYELSAGQAQFDNYSQLREQLDMLKTHQAKYSYTIETVVHQSRRLGTVTIPKRIVMDDETVFLRLCGNKQSEFRRFQTDARLIREHLPQLETWLYHHPQEVIDNHGQWDDLLRVCDYFIEHPKPERYIRELPIPVHTKFIEQHMGILKSLLDTLLPPEAIQADETQFERRYGLRYDEKKLIRLRFLDDSVRQLVGCPFSDISVRPSELGKISIPAQKCLIVENKMTFLTLPILPDTIAIWGHGFQVDLLRHVEWLADCATFYWGDLDTQGFQILSQLRSLYPETIAVMMDNITLQTYTDYIVAGTPTTLQVLPHLSLDEAFLFQHLLQNNQRLEQEHIHQEYAMQQLRQLVCEA